jgi:hypothetical protein
MAELIDSKEALQIAISQEQWASEPKDRFYRQFLPLPATSRSLEGSQKLQSCLCWQHVDSSLERDAEERAESHVAN